MSQHATSESVQAAAQEAVDSMIVVMARRKALEASFEQRSLDLKASYERELDRLDSDLESQRQILLKLVDEQPRLLFGEVAKSLRTKFGALMTRTISSRPKIDEKALLETARALGLVRTLFDAHVEYTLKPDVFERLDELDERREAVEDCIAREDAIISVSIKPDEHLPQVDARHLGGRSIPVGKINRPELHPE